MDAVTALILIVGLGNPGPQYALNRHNIGFAAVDILAEEYGAGVASNKYSGELRQATYQGRKILLFKPLTYMNLSGDAVQKVAKFYKLKPEQIIVIHDEIDLAPAEVRFKTGGGAAGHNGLKDIDRHIGNGYHRVRIGVGHPGHKDQVSNYVLQNFSKEELNGWVPEVLGKMPDYIDDILEEKF